MSKVSEHMLLTKLSEGWEVEWCTELPCVEGTNDADIDRAKYQRADYPTKSEAMKVAKRVLRFDQFGSVRVTQFHSERYEPDCPATYREYDGDSIIVES